MRCVIESTVDDWGVISWFKTVVLFYVFLSTNRHTSTQNNFLFIQSQFKVWISAVLLKKGQWQLIFNVDFISSNLVVTNINCIKLKFCSWCCWGRLKHKCIFLSRWPSDDPTEHTAEQKLQTHVWVCPVMCLPHTQSLYLEGSAFSVCTSMDSSSHGNLSKSTAWRVLRLACRIYSHRPMRAQPVLSLHIWE